MRLAFIISSVAHIAMVLLAAYGLPWFLANRDLPEQIMLVELVTISDVTTSQVKKEPEPKPKPEPEPEKKKPVKAAKKPPSPPPEPEPEPPKAVVAPPPKPEPKAEPAPEPKPEPKKVAKAPPPKQKPKPPAKKKPKKTEAKKPVKKTPEPKKAKFDSKRIAALLSKDASESPSKKTDEKAKKPEKQAPQQPQPVRAARMTMTQIDAIRYQIQQCWSMPSGARDAENLQVRIKIFLNPDGSLAQAPKIVDSLRLQRDEFWRTAAESARRAVLKCSPLKNLPVEKYDHWREITLTFDPKEMLGG